MLSPQYELFCKFSCFCCENLLDSVNSFCCCRGRGLSSGKVAGAIFVECWIRELALAVFTGKFQICRSKVFRNFVGNNFAACTLLKVARHQLVENIVFAPNVPILFILVFFLGMILFIFYVLCFSWSWDVSRSIQCLLFLLYSLGCYIMVGPFLFILVFFLVWYGLFFLFYVFLDVLRMIDCLLSSSSQILYRCWPLFPCISFYLV